MQCKVLLLEQDQIQAKIFSDWLQSAGIDSISPRNANNAVSALNEQSFDAVVLSWNTDDGGARVLEHLRYNVHSTTPVLYVPTTNNRRRIADTLHAGANDFLIKPFAQQVFVKRVSSMIAHYSNQQSLLNCYPYQFDEQNQDILLHGKSLSLSAEEYALAAYLFFYRNRIILSGDLARELWSDTSPAATLAVDLQAMRLKRRLRLREIASWKLQSLLGIGYRLNSLSDQQPAYQQQLKLQVRG